MRSESERIRGRDAFPPGNTRCNIYSFKKQAFDSTISIGHNIKFGPNHVRIFANIIRQCKNPLFCRFDSYAVLGKALRCNISNKKHMHKLISTKLKYYNVHLFFCVTLKRYITRYHKHIICHTLCG